MDFFRWQIVLCFGVVFLVIFSFAFAINGMTREAILGRFGESEDDRFQQQILIRGFPKMDESG
jgi:hypothetical protein